MIGVGVLGFGGFRGLLGIRIMDSGLWEGFQELAAMRFWVVGAECTQLTWDLRWDLNDWYFQTDIPYRMSYEMS